MNIENDLGDIKSVFYRLTREKYQWALDFYDDLMTDAFKVDNQDEINMFSKMKVKFLEKANYDAVDLFVGFCKLCQYLKLSPTSDREDIQALFRQTIEDYREIHIAIEDYSDHT